jgi:RNA polymerase sigma-70 factor (ECF subfamily)
MIQDVSIPLAADHPVAVALNDAEVRLRLGSAARAFLGRRAAELSPIQRTAEAEAIVQEAEKRAWKNRDRFKEPGDVVAWLVGFVANVTREFVRDRCRQATSPPPDGPGLEALAVDRSRPVDDAVADKLLAEQLLGQLPPDDRAIVRMRHCEGMTCAEIGERIGIRENTARVRLHRALARLRRQCGVTGEGQP